MKQHIILNELEKSGKKVYTGWIKWHDTKKHFISSALNPEIGEMIEFLDDDVAWSRLVILSQHDSDYGMSYRVICFKKEYESEELCDALWEAVKEILNA